MSSDRKDFGHDVALQLFKSLVSAAREESAVEPNQSRAEAYQEILSRINFDERTVDLSDFDAGEISEACLILVQEAVAFGLWLAAQGIELDPREFQMRTDH